MNETREIQATSQKINLEYKRTNKEISRKFAGSRLRRRSNRKKAEIKYKKSSREKTAKILAAQDIAQKRGITKAYGLPDWIDHDVLWDAYRKDPLTFSM